MNNKAIPSMLVLLFVACTAAFGQLINGGFESYTSLPVQAGQISVLNGWLYTNTIASPDYYNYLCNTSCDIPETPVAIVEAYEGEGIVGMIVAGRRNTNTREYLTANFAQALVPGTKYDVRFSITNGQRTMVSTAGLGVKGIGALFSTNLPMQINQSPILQTPQFKIDSLVYNKEWKTISFSFVADQPYRYMTIGLFGSDDQNNITIIEGENPAYAYYFFDDFSITLNPGTNRPDNEHGEKNPEHIDPVVEVSPTVPYYIPNSFSPNGDGQNDTFSPVAGLVSEWTFSVFDRWGNKVYYTVDPKSGWDGSFQSKNAEPGVYVWSVKYKVYDEKKGWYTQEDQGTVTLIR